MARATSYAPPISAEQLLEASPDAVLVVDEHGRIRLANRRAEALFGYAGGLSERSIEELLPDRVTLEVTGEVLRVGGRRRDGGALPLELHLTSMRGGLVHVTAVRSRGSGQVAYEGLLHHVPDAIVAVDGRGVIRFVNERAERLFGYSRGELVGQPIDVLAPERSSSVRHLSDLSDDTNLEVVARRSDGTTIDTDVSLSTVTTPDGELVVASVHDVTARKRRESEHDAVAADVLADERDLERADFEVQLHQAQRLESIGRLAGGIAHDFNNLLGVIMMYASFVSERLTAGEDATLEREDIVGMSADVQAVKDVAAKAAALTHKLLTFGRREVVAPEVLDLNEVLRSMEDLLRRTIGENVDELCMVLWEGALAVKADRGQLDQVVMNLAVNARDAMLGGGRLDVRTSVVTIPESNAPAGSLRAGRYARLAVSDTGVGMSREVAERAFDPFFTTKGSAGGSGLGLATVYGIVKQAGGDVAIASSPGAGTMVTVLLPLTDERRTAAPRSEEQLAGGHGHETVLFVEDEEMFQQPAIRVLAAHGYHVLGASNAGEALALSSAHEGEIHLVVTDIVMPGPSGPELVRSLLERRPAIRVMYTSGYGWDGFDHDAPGGASRLDKPFAASELLRCVRLTLDAT